MIIFGQNFVFLSNVLLAKKRPFLPVSPRNPTSYKKSTFFCFESVAFFLHYFFLPLVSPTFSLCSLVFLLEWIFLYDW